MNSNNQKHYENLNKINSKRNHFNPSGKIMEKLIVINNENTIQREKKIKEFEIVIKNLKINNNSLKRQKSDNIFKINKNQHLKKPINKEPYLKPTFQPKNKNSFSIKSNNKQNNINDDIKNIYLNFFKVYYDENGKKVKIIKNKSNCKENKSKEIILTQNGITLNKNLANDRNNKLKKNDITDCLGITNTVNYNKNKENKIRMKFFYPDTPSQSTTTEKKSNERSRNNEDNFSNIKNSEIELFIKEDKFRNYSDLIKKNIYYDNLPQFLRNKNQKSDKRYKKKNTETKIVLNSTEKSSFINKRLNKLNKENSCIKQQLLISGLNNVNNKELNLNKKAINKAKNDSLTNKRINYFQNDISNLTLNMTFEQNNITNTINPDNQKIKNIYISSFKRKIIKKDHRKDISPLLRNNYENIKLNNKTLNSSSFGIQGKYFLFNFFRDHNNRGINRNKSSGYQNLKNIYPKLDTYEAFIRENLNLSCNKCNIMRNNCINFSNTYNDKENDINLLNKTKEILKIKEDDLKILNDSKIVNTLLTNSQSCLDNFPKSFFIKNNSIKKGNNNYINEKLTKIPNIDNNINSKTMIQNNNFENHTVQLNKNKRPISLYINKKLNIKKKKNKKRINSNNFFSLNDYYNSAIDKESHLNKNINNILKSIQNLDQNYQYKKIYKNIEKRNEIDNYELNFSEHENIKKNLYDQKFINLNQNNSSLQLINKRIKNNNIFKFNRNKCFIDYSSNSSLNFIPSFIKINKTYINDKK